MTATEPSPDAVHAASPGAAMALVPYAGVRVLVTGATGFVGRWVWRLLARAGAEVHVTGRSRERLEAVPFPGHRVVAGLETPGALTRLVEALRPAVVFNLAGYGVERGERDPAVSRRLNVGVAVEAALAVSSEGEVDGWEGQRLVHAGSAFEYGCVEGEVREDAAPHPIGRYAADKLEGTRRVGHVGRGSGVAMVTARLFTVYGPGEHPHRLLPTLLRAASESGPVPLTAGEQTRDFTYVRDVAEGLLRLGLLPGAPPVVNLATGTPTTVRAFTRTAAGVAGVDAERLRFGEIPYPPGEVWQGAAEVSLLRSTLGWTPPTSVEEGIRATLRAAAPRGKVEA